MRLPGWPRRSARAVRPAVPCAVTRPLAMITMRSHSAATSCMMWLEKITQRPSPRSSLQEPAQSARGHHVEAVGGLVEDHVASGRGPARARSRSWCAGPARSLRSARSRKSSICSACASLRGARGDRPPATCRAARRSSRCSRARSGACTRHAHPAARRGCGARVRRRWPRRCRPPARGRDSGDIRVYSMRSVVVLPAPLGPSRPVISPSRAVKPTSSTAMTGVLSLPRPGKVLRRCSATIIASVLLEGAHGCAPLKLMKGEG